MKFLNIFFLLLATSFLSAQTVKINDRLVLYIPFDNYPLVDKSGNNNFVRFSGDSTLNCGVNGAGAMKFDGLTANGTNGLIVGSSLTDVFKTGDFSMSFYIRPSTQGGSQTQDLFSKRTSCNSDSASFAVRYTPNTNTMSVELIQNSAARHVIVQRLDFAKCWQHVVIVRNFNRLLLYVNGKLKQTNTYSLPKRINITNDKSFFQIANSPCALDRKYLGSLDELRLYDRAINEDEVAALYYSPDQIATRDTIIFLGDVVKTSITSTCATDFTWTPKDDIADNKKAATTITPTKGGDFKYVLTMKEAQCSSVDTLKVKVVDPKDLDCGKVYMPSAFTPNGDDVNNEFFISNPNAIEAITAFEILDNWGGRIFYTTNKFERWDGSFNGKTVNPGVFLWKVRYKCRGQELSAFGTVTVLK